MKSRFFLDFCFLLPSENFRFGAWAVFQHPAKESPLQMVVSDHQACIIPALP